MDHSNKRRHVRLKHQAKIKLILPVSQAYIVKMKDFSESGLFLYSSDEVLPPIGTIVQVQTTELEDAPIQTAKVIRVEQGVGFGLEFLLP